VTAETDKTFRVTVRVAFDNGHSENAEVVVLLFDDGDQPYAVLAWRDGFDQTIADVGL